MYNFNTIIDWYSTESYYLVKFIIDLVPNPISMTIFTIIQFEYNSFEIFLLFLWPLLLSTITFQSWGHLVGITCGNKSLMALIILYALQLL